MGPLTESMTRLCGEIVALRGTRLTFVRDLGQDVTAMKAEFRRAHTEMARRTKAERQGFVKDLGHAVATMQAGFRRAHRAMARQTKAERRAAVNRLRKSVGGMRREFALDLAGAHRAWCGPSRRNCGPRPRPSAGPRPRRNSGPEKLLNAIAWQHWLWLRKRPSGIKWSPDLRKRRGARQKEGVNSFQV